MANIKHESQPFSIQNPFPAIQTWTIIIQHLPATRWQLHLPRYPATVDPQCKASLPNFSPVRDPPTSTSLTIMFLPQQLKTLAPLRRRGRILAIPLTVLIDEVNLLISSNLVYGRTSYTHVAMRVGCIGSGKRKSSYTSFSIWFTHPTLLIQYKRCTRTTFILHLSWQCSIWLWNKASSLLWAPARTTTGEANSQTKWVS